MAVTYTTAANVAALLMITISGSSTPTTAQVESIINRKEDWIDQFTGHAWRSVSVGDSANNIYEHHNIETKTWHGELGYPIKLRHRRIRSVTLLEVWNGSTWLDWVASSSFTEGRDKDYYIDYDKGIIYLKNRAWVRYKDVRVTYTYGDQTVAKDIEEACTKLAAADVIVADQYANNFPEGAQGTPMLEWARTWKSDAEDILKSRREIRVVTG